VTVPLFVILPPFVSVPLVIVTMAPGETVSPVPALLFVKPPVPTFSTPLAPAPTVKPVEVALMVTLSADAVYAFGMVTGLLSSTIA
jgi:hypothetical protein